jgi:hypothetical protein
MSNFADALDFRLPQPHLAHTEFLTLGTNKTRPARVLIPIFRESPRDAWAVGGDFGDSSESCNHEVAGRVTVGPEWQVSNTER